ncbi:alpha-ketoacid dehydrogenase subunit beta [Companilactobacillus nodensis]|uniref:Acetoin dehydrogenase complex n=1 Tax=Companilactobacillus nodensis DSM 19682 = JCM 14932 = NBRC 107160 TaxID=1423775 RepID=A0A0R1KAC0_9LACO|nr:alpha-ketoacid dehydrogenase subunit beta [Companilactobacillus nodensis]KRK80638.1 acetoin dehydrogenase complex [Companilactobacillus nodensis DSM 19682 = JCM 14932 = NBRC 107160]
MSEKSYLEALNLAITEEMRHDEGVMIFGEDVGGVKGGVFGVTKGLAEEFGDKRVFNSPLGESEIAGLAVGLGVMGHHAIAEFQFADYILPAVNQIMSEATKMRYKSAGDWISPIVMRTPYGGGVRGGFYHSQSTEKIFAGQPGLRIVTPSTVYDAKGLLKSAIRSEDPVLFYEHKKLYRSIKDDIPDDDYTVPLDKANILKQGDDVTVIAYGVMLQFALKAAEELKDEFSVEVVDLRSLYPIDKETVLEAVRKTGKVLLITEDTKEGSVMNNVSAIIAEEVLFDLDAPIKILAGPDSPSMPYAKDLEDAFLVNQADVTKSIRELAEF